MTRIIETRRKLKSRLDAKQDVSRSIPALMGDGNGNIEVTNQPGYVYIRVGGGDLGQAFNNRVPLADNLAIDVGYDPITDPDRRIFQVLSVRMADYAGGGSTPYPNLPNHHLSHEFGGGDDVYVSWRRLMGFRVGRPAGFVVTIDEGNIIRAGAWLAVVAQTLDLTASKPASSTQARYVLISLNAAGVAIATAGALVAVALLDISDCPIPAAGNIPLAAVRLYGTQTAIGDTPTAPDIVDLRFPQAYGTGGSNLFGTGAANELAYFSAAITLTSSPFIKRETGYLDLGVSGTANVGGFKLNTTGGFAPFAFTISSAIWGGFTNDIMGWGYNTNGTGKIAAGVADLGWNLEADYFNAGIHNMEWNFAFNNPGATYGVRPFNMSMNRDATSENDSMLKWVFRIGNGASDSFAVSKDSAQLFNVTPSASITLFNVADPTSTTTLLTTFDAGNTKALWTVSAPNGFFQLNNPVLIVGKLTVFPGTGTNIIDLETTTSLVTPSWIRWFRVADNWSPAAIGQIYSNNVYGGHLVFYTNTAPGPAGLTEAMRINETQNISMTSLTASTVIYSNASKVLTSLANAAGYLTNDGAGALSWSATATPAAHNVLNSTYHGDVLTGAITRGDLLYGNATPKIARLALGGASGSFLTRDATDVVWSGFYLAGTVAQTYTFPGASATLAELGANTFIAKQTVSHGTSADIDFTKTGASAGTFSFINDGSGHLKSETTGTGYLYISATLTGFRTTYAGTTNVTIGNGIQVGAPTGGDKGAGTINTAGDIYKNNSAYTNPDYVLEQWVKGKIERFSNKPRAKNYQRMTLDEIERHIKMYLRLPGMTDEPSGIFDRADRMLEKLEEIFTYLIEIDHRLIAIEA